MAVDEVGRELGSRTTGATTTDAHLERIKRIGFGFRRLHHYRIRALLYAGRPNWALLATTTPR